MEMENVYWSIKTENIILSTGKKALDIFLKYHFMHSFLAHNAIGGNLKIYIRIPLFFS